MPILNQMKSTDDFRIEFTDAEAIQVAQYVQQRYPNTVNAYVQRVYQALENPYHHWAQATTPHEFLASIGDVGDQGDLGGDLMFNHGIESMVPPGVKAFASHGESYLLALAGWAAYTATYDPAGTNPLSQKLAEVFNNTKDNLTQTIDTGVKRLKEQELRAAQPRRSERIALRPDQLRRITAAVNERHATAVEDYLGVIADKYGGVGMMKAGIPTAAGLVPDSARAEVASAVRSGLYDDVLPGASEATRSDAGSIADFLIATAGREPGTRDAYFSAQGMSADTVISSTMDSVYRNAAKSTPAELGVVPMITPEASRF